MAPLERAEASPSSSALVEINRDLMKRLAEAEERMARLEEENREFAQMYVEAQQENQTISNLYVASYRLHATLDPEQVMTVIQEILIELLGAEEFGVFLLDERSGVLHLVADEGLRDRLPNEAIPVGEGIVGDVAVTGEPFYFDCSDPAGDVRLPRAAIPLKMERRTVGVVVIYRLLSHKANFSRMDHRLLELLAAHAATALVSARLHSTLDRKLKTVEGFLQLLRPRLGH